MPSIAPIPLLPRLRRSRLRAEVSFLQTIVNSFGLVGVVCLLLVWWLIIFRSVFTRVVSLFQHATLPGIQANHIRKAKLVFTCEKARPLCYDAYLWLIALDSFRRLRRHKLHAHGRPQQTLRGSTADPTA